jgi:hypothetical protein
VRQGCAEGLQQVPVLEEWLCSLQVREILCSGAKRLVQGELACQCRLEWFVRACACKQGLDHITYCTGDCMSYAILYYAGMTPDELA